MVLNSILKHYCKVEVRLLADKTIKCLANTHPVNEYGNGNT